MNKTMLKTSIAIVDSLYERLSQNAVICGGFARDTFYGLESKDVDIMLLDPQYVDYGAVDRELNSIARSIDEFATVCRHSGEEYMDDRIEAVWQIFIDGFTIDVLWYNPRIYSMGTGEEACRAFDFNINQFYIDEYGQSAFGGLEHDHPSKVKALVQLESVSDQRIARMSAKWELIQSKI